MGHSPSPTGCEGNSQRGHERYNAINRVFVDGIKLDLIWSEEALIERGVRRQGVSLKKGWQLTV